MSAAGEMKTLLVAAVAAREVSAEQCDALGVIAPLPVLGVLAGLGIPGMQQQFLHTLVVGVCHARIMAQAFGAPLLLQIDGWRAISPWISRGRRQAFPGRGDGLVRARTILDRELALRIDAVVDRLGPGKAGDGRQQQGQRESHDSDRVAAPDAPVGAVPGIGMHGRAAEGRA